jgi:hypothetical protein
MCELYKRDLEIVRAQLECTTERKRWRDTEYGLLLAKITELERQLSERSAEQVQTPTQPPPGNSTIQE